MIYLNSCSIVVRYSTSYDSLRSCLSEFRSNFHPCKFSVGLAPLFQLFHVQSPAALYYTNSFKPGASRVSSNGENLGKKIYYGDDEQRTRLWKHTEEVVQGALKT